MPSDIRDANAADVASRALAVLRELGVVHDDAARVTIGATVADDGELDPAPLVEALVRLGAQVAYARVRDETMGFALVDSPASLMRGPGGVQQPSDDAVDVAPHDLDVVLVPLVAFDDRCNRIGRGAAHYDRTFAGRGRRPLLIGLAHDEQRIADCAPRRHDVALDLVVTPTAVFGSLPG